MRAEELRDLARRAANRTGYRQILVLGSQAVHGALPDADLPANTTMSEEADLAVLNDLSGDAEQACVVVTRQRTTTYSEPCRDLDLAR